MALGDNLLQGIRSFAAGPGVSRRDIVAQDETEAQKQELQRLLGGIRESGDFSPTNPLIGELATVSPSAAADVSTSFGNLDKNRRVAMIGDAFDILQDRNNPERALARARERVKDGLSIDSPMTDTIDFHNDLTAALQSGDQANVDAVFDGVEEFVNFFSAQEGIDLGRGTQDTAAVRTFERLTELSEDPDVPVNVRNAAKVQLGLRTKEGTKSKDERIAEDEDLQGKILSFSDRAERIKAQAREEGKATGIATTELEDMEAMLPTLRESVDRLIKLADVATFTKGGKAFDTLSRELGFGATEGSTARAQLVSIVDNQVLPLLRATFGAAFTEGEGERLRDTLVDPDSAPEEKKAQLNNFIDFKEREIQAKRRRVGGAPTTGGTLVFNPETGELE